MCRGICLEMAYRECVRCWMSVVLLTVWQGAHMVPLGMLWKRLRLRTTLWVCRELVWMWGGLTKWDGRPDEIQAEDPIRVFEETMDLGQGNSGWGRYVVYVTWLQEMHGADHAC